MIDIIARALALKKTKTQGASEDWVEEQIDKLTTLNQSPTEISDSTEVLEGLWSKTELAEPDSESIAKYVTKIALPAGYNKAPVALLKDENGFLYNVTMRIYNGYLYIYTNTIPSSGEIIIKL